MKSRWLLGIPALLLALSAIAAEARQVLVIYPNSRLLPANIAFDSGLREAINALSEMTFCASAKSSNGCALCLPGTKLGGSRSI